MAFTTIAIAYEGRKPSHRTGGPSIPLDSQPTALAGRKVNLGTQLAPCALGIVSLGEGTSSWAANWVDVPDASPISSKALSVVIGAGWVLRPARRFGLQVFGAQHVAGLGDLQTSVADIQDVVGNFWSLGAAVVIR